MHIITQQMSIIKMYIFIAREANDEAHAKCMNKNWLNNQLREKVILQVEHFPLSSDVQPSRKLFSSIDF